MNNVHAKSHELLKKSLIKNSFFLLFRQVIVYGLNLLGAIFAARFLSISDYGFFAVMSFIYVVMASLSDPGLAASLIRQKDDPTNYEYSVIFTSQLILTVSVIFIFLTISPYVIKIYNFDNILISLYLICLALFISIFSIIPITASQRNLLFNQIAYFDIIQAIIFNLLLIVLIFYGYGIVSFAIALLAKIIVSDAYIIFVSPWRIAFNWNWRLIKQHFKFGIHYQGVRIVSLIKDSFTPIFIGAIVGAIAVGYLNWINLVALFPTMAIFLLQKIYMPYFSKVQSNRTTLSNLVGNMIFATNFVVAFFSILILLLIQPITTIIFGNKWVDAIPYFYFIWISNIFVPTASVFIGLFDAIGLSKINFKYSILWMLFNWLLGIPAVYFFGLLGFVVVVSIAQATNIFLYIEANKYVDINYKSILQIWLLAIFSGAFIYTTNGINNIISFFDLIIFSFYFSLVYFFSAYILFNSKIKNILSLFDSKIHKDISS